jgi:hypothetical protein
MDASIFRVTRVVCTLDAIVTKRAIHEECTTRLVRTRIHGAFNSVYASVVNRNILTPNGTVTTVCRAILTVVTECIAGLVYAACHGTAGVRRTRDTIVAVRIIGREVTPVGFADINRATDSVLAVVVLEDHFTAFCVCAGVHGAFNPIITEGVCCDIQAPSNHVTGVQ